MKLRDYLGWPVVTIKGRPITNLIRRVILTNWRQTWKHRNQINEDVPGPLRQLEASGCSQMASCRYEQQLNQSAPSAGPK